MNDILTQEIDEPQVPVSGPGNRLTDARLKLGLEPKNVAEMLHLREHQIRALEADDYDNLPEPTYVKGYLRAYCQLLSLDSDSVVKQYSDFITPPVKESFEGLATERQAVSNDSLMKLVSVGMVALVGGLALVYWLSQEDAPREVDTTVQAGTLSEMVQAQNEASPLPGGADETGASAAPPGLVADASRTSAEQPTMQSATNTGSPPEPVTESSGVVAPPVQEQQSPSAGNAEPELASSAGLQNEVSLLPEVDTSVRTRLVIKVADGSWVDIRDAHGNKLIYETVPAGREIPLEGLAPLSVFLGNAEGVDLLVEGSPFDFAKHRRGLTARFKIERLTGNR